MSGERRDSLTGKTESELIRLAQEGDRFAYDELVRRHQRNVYRWAYNIVRHHDTADDVAQEVFVRTFLALDRIDPERPLGSWLCKTAVNVALNILRKQRFRAQWAEDQHLGMAEEHAAADEPDALLRRRRVIQKLEAAIQELPPIYRMALLLRTRDHMSYEQIADALGVSLGTVMSRLARARQRLRTMMGSSLDDLYE
jgi:RNA polymerase sigma-70 factor, ECF subfamily